MRDQVWGFVFGFLGVIIALASLILAIPQAAPIRSGIAQTFSGTPAPANASKVVPTPPLASAETLAENIVLKCNDCSDPIVVTITSIKVEPQYNRMTWALSFFNNSQDLLFCSLDPFTLQSPLNDNSFGASVSPIPSIGSDSTTPVFATFSFIPYTKVQYTLNAGLNGGVQIQFLPVKVTF